MIDVCACAPAFWTVELRPCGRRSLVGYWENSVLAQVHQFCVYTMCVYICYIPNFLPKIIGIQLNTLELRWACP